MFKKILLASLILLAFVGVAEAHSFYSAWCCNSMDCHPVACDAIQQLSNGNFSYDGLEFAKDHVYPTQDTQCHACIINESISDKALRIARCLYISLGT